MLLRDVISSHQSEKHINYYRSEQMLNSTISLEWSRYWSEIIWAIQLGHLYLPQIFLQVFGFLCNAIWLFSVFWVAIDSPAFIKWWAQRKNRYSNM